MTEQLNKEKIELIRKELSSTILKKNIVALCKLYIPNFKQSIGGEVKGKWDLESELKQYIKNFEIDEMKSNINENVKYEVVNTPKDLLNMIKDEKMKEKVISHFNHFNGSTDNAHVDYSIQYDEESGDFQDILEHWEHGGDITIECNDCNTIIIGRNDEAKVYHVVYAERKNIPKIYGQFLNDLEFIIYIDQYE